MVSIINVFEEGFELVRKNYFKFLILYAMIYCFILILLFVAVLIAFVLGVFLIPVGANIIAIMAFLLILLGIVLLVEPIWVGSYYSMALQGLGGGVSVTYAIREAVRKYVPLLWTIALEALVFVVIDAIIFSPLLFVFPGFISSLNANVSSGAANGSSLSGTVLSFFGLSLLLVLVYLVVTAVLTPLLFEAVPLVMLESTGGVKAIRESVDIGEKHFWNILSLIVLLILFIFAIEFVGGIMVVLVSFVNNIAGVVVNLIVSFFLGAFVGAWSNSLPIVYYRDFLAKNK